jgi:hypothetical protein
MDHRIRRSLAVRHFRIEQANARPDAGFVQDLHEADASGPHRMRLEPGFVVLRRDDDELEIRPLAHAPCQALRDPAAGEELVFDTVPPGRNRPTGRG